MTKIKQIKDGGSIYQFFQDPEEPKLFILEDLVSGSEFLLSRQGSRKLATAITNYLKPKATAKKPAAPRGRPKKAAVAV